MLLAVPLSTVTRDINVTVKAVLREFQRVFLCNLRSLTHGPLRQSPSYPLDTTTTNPPPNQTHGPILCASFSPLPRRLPHPVCSPSGRRTEKQPPCRPPRARAAFSRPRRPPGSPAYSGGPASGGHQARRVPSCSISMASPPRRPLRITPGASPPAWPPNPLVSSLSLESLNCVVCSLRSQCAARGFAWRVISSNWWRARRVAG